MNIAVLLAAIGALGGLGGAYAVYDGIRKNRAAKVQGAAQGQQVIVQSAVTLLEPLQERVEELQKECKELRGQVADLTAEVEHQRIVANETTVKLEAANRRADYYQHAFEQRAGN